MPTVIDYELVQQRMGDGGFVCLYHNSGAFGFARTEGVQTRGWIGPDDPTIRDAARAMVRQFPAPFESNLSEALGRVRDALTGDAWLMPKSHWHYELHFGNHDLLETLLPELGIDASLLRDRNNGSAISFTAAETDLMNHSVQRLLERLVQSDFLLAFPDAATVCTIHHHKQLWWQTTSERVTSLVDSVSL